VAKYKLRILKMGEADVPGPEVYWMSHWFGWETLYFYMIVIQGEGITALINTGPPDDLTELNKFWVSAYGDKRTEMNRQDSERPVAALASIGLKPSEVQYIFITPLQAYADANISKFPDAKGIFISRKGWIEDFFAPPPPSSGFPRKLVIPDDQVIYLTTQALDRVHLVEDGDEVLPGIRTLWAGVHHRSSMAISIPTESGKVVISDCFFKYGNIEKNHPLGVNESLEEGRHTYERIRREADLTIPLYDPEVYIRFPDGIIK
jgi:glyoxylase-like metal-dependent hydrolase (beta-lactamase superfamily II)